MNGRSGLAVALAAALFLTACGTKGPEKKRIAVVVKALDSEFWMAVKRGVEEAAREHPDLDVAILAPQREIDIDQQVSIIEDQLVRKVSALVVAPAGVAQVTPALEKARTRGIPVILVDTDAPWPGKLSFVGTDNKLGGKLAGEFLAKRLNGKGKVALIRGVLGVETHESRVAGFKEGLASTPGITIVSDQPANSDRALGMSVMENVLTAHKDLAAVFATNDQMALGALEAVMARRLGDRVAVVAFDAGKEVVDHITAGRIAAAVAQKPQQMGYLSVKAAARAVRGEPVERRIDTGTELIISEAKAGAAKKE